MSKSNQIKCLSATTNIILHLIGFEKMTQLSTVGHNCLHIIAYNCKAYL